ncbi:helix-turn-helix domain-containing protein [Acuticoccus kandeliae]|uniref:helix-turn-helix domain-containing protein n=1 Tax=Acuticoccus kandeliae TaxID=2073160 RepID=UPI000D3E0644|nr:helix-turn-helix domain-containing protein [Acuticoccus kandeliae]
MDTPGPCLHYSNMRQTAAIRIPVFDLYGERRGLPDILHCETIAARSSLHGWNIRPHRHFGLHQFLLVAEGAATIRWEGEERALAVPGLVSVPSRVVHGFRFAPETTGYVLSLPVELVEPSIRLAPMLAAPATGPADARIAHLFAEAAHEHAGFSPMRDQNLAALAILIAGRVAEAIDATGAGRGARPPLLARFEALIEAHFREHWRVGDYAASLGVSAAHLSRVCREGAGASASHLIEARLVVEARRLLAYTAHPVARIADDLGFADPAYFTRAFSRATSMTPTAFRARLASAVPPGEH